LSRARAVWRWLRWPRRVVGAFLVFTVAFAPIYTIGADVVRLLGGHTPAPAVVAAPPGIWHVYVTDLGYHTSITLAQPLDIPGAASSATLGHPGPPGWETAPYVEWGWGDRGFYQYSDFSPLGVYAALFLPTASVVYLDGDTREPTNRGVKSLWVRDIDGATAVRLMAHMELSVQHDAQGARLPASGYVRGYHGQFYPAHGRYLWTRDCNHWVAEELALVGLASSSFAVVTSGQVVRRLVGFTRVSDTVTHPGGSTSPAW
jgi:uncharacterized protein (TIGR02117 family)